MTCKWCQAEVTNGLALCSRCQHTGRRALFNVTAYHADLFTLPAQTLGVRYGHKVSDPTGSAVSLASVSDPIEDVAAATKAMLTRWLRRLVDDRPRAFMPNEGTVEVLAKVLTQQLHAIAGCAWAGEFVTELLALERRLRRTVEANKGLWYAGVCGTDTETGAYCTRVLYADPDKDQVRCPVCRTVWPVTERRRILLEAARDEVTNVATIARACAVLLGDQTSQAKLERRIQNWIDRGDIERRGSRDIDGRLRKVYRVGDVLDMLLDTRQKATTERTA